MGWVVVVVVVCLVVPKRTASASKNAMRMTSLWSVCPRGSLSRKMLLHVQKIPYFLDEKHEVLFGETAFH